MYMEPTWQSAPGHSAPNQPTKPALLVVGFISIRSVRRSRCAIAPLQKGNALPLLRAGIGICMARGRIDWFLTVGIIDAGASTFVCPCDDPVQSAGWKIWSRKLPCPKLDKMGLSGLCWGDLRNIVPPMAQPKFFQTPFLSLFLIRYFSECASHRFKVWPSLSNFKDSATHSDPSVSFWPQPPRLTRPGNGARLGAKPAAVAAAARDPTDPHFSEPHFSPPRSPLVLRTPKPVSPAGGPLSQQSADKYEQWSRPKFGRVGNCGTSSPRVASRQDGGAMTKLQGSKWRGLAKWMAGGCWGGEM